MAQIDPGRMLMLMHMNKQFVDVNIGTNGIFVGASDQRHQPIMPGLFGDQKMTIMNSGDATTYYLATLNQGFAGTNNPFGPRELYSAGASSLM